MLSKNADQFESLENTIGSDLGVPHQSATSGSAQANARTPQSSNLTFKGQDGNWKYFFNWFRHSVFDENAIVK